VKEPGLQSLADFQVSLSLSITVIKSIALYFA